MRLIHAAVLSLSLIPLAAAAQDEDALEQAVEARHGYMLGLALNMAPLAAMAKGDVPYDEATATFHARNLAALGAYQVQMHFLPGTAQGEIEDSDMLPAALANLQDVTAKHDALQQATAAAPAGVVGGQQQVAAVVQNIGGACKACHDQYRAK